MVDVECARGLVRGLTPITFQFELEGSSACRPQLEFTNQFIRMLNDRYSVNISYREGDNGTLILMKGCVKDFERMKEAGRLMFGKTCEGTTLGVSLQMHVSANYFNVVCGPNMLFVHTVMDKTSTRIICTGPGDLGVPVHKRGTFLIMGSMENIFQARQMFQGTLPVLLKFDIGNEFPTKETFLRQLQLAYNIDIFIKLKSRDESQTAMMKTEERNASRLYLARHQLLQLNGEPLEAGLYKVPYILIFYPTSNFLNLELILQIEVPLPLFPI